MKLRSLIFLLLPATIVAAILVGSWLFWSRAASVSDLPEIIAQLEGKSCSFRSKIDGRSPLEAFSPNKINRKEMECRRVITPVSALHPGRLGCLTHAAFCTARFLADSTAAVPALTALLQKDLQDFDLGGYRRENVQNAALLALSISNDQRAVNAAIPFLASKGNLRTTASKMLEEFGPAAKTALPELKRALKYLEGYERLTLLSALVAISPQEALEELEAALKDDKPAVRNFAIRNLPGKISLNAASALDNALDQPETADAALKALQTVEIGDTDKLKRILKILDRQSPNNSDRKVLFSTIDTLKSLGPSAASACPKLLPYLETQNYELLKTLFEALAAICPADPQTIDAALHLLEAPESVRRKILIRFLAASTRLLNHKIEKLTPLLHDSAPGIGLEVRQALVKLGASINQIKKWQRSKPEDILFERQSQLSEILDQIMRKSGAVFSVSAKFEIERNPSFGHSRRAVGNIFSTKFSKHKVKQKTFDQQQQIVEQLRRITNGTEQWEISEYPASNWRESPEITRKLRGSNHHERLSPLVSFSSNYCGSKSLWPLGAKRENGRWSSKLVFKGFEDLKGQQCYRLEQPTLSNKYVYWIAVSDGLLRKKATYHTGGRINIVDHKAPAETLTFWDLELNPAFNNNDFTFTPDKGQQIKERMNDSKSDLRREYRW